MMYWLLKYIFIVHSFFAGSNTAAVVGGAVSGVLGLAVLLTVVLLIILLLVLKRKVS